MKAKSLLLLSSSIGWLNPHALLPFAPYTNRATTNPAPWSKEEIERGADRNRKASERRARRQAKRERDIQRSIEGQKKP